MNTRAIIAATGVFVFAGVTAVAGAEEVVFDDPGIFAPTNNSRVDVYWVDSIAGYTGELRWEDTALNAPPTALWTNKSAVAGDQYTLGRLLSQGERVDFTYAVTVGQIDTFSMGNPGDWSQFMVDASNPFDVLVGVEDIRYPRGDMDHNDAVFRVVFSEVAVPAPASFALLGGGCLIMLRRRR